MLCFVNSRRGMATIRERQLHVSHPAFPEVRRLFESGD